MHTSVKRPPLNIEVKINLTFNNLQIINSEVVQAVVPYVTNATMTPSLRVDYIYLDTDERRRFAQVSPEYLIEQVQEENFAGTSSRVKES